MHRQLIPLKHRTHVLRNLRQHLLEGKDNELQPIKLDADEYSYYIHTGEEWFLDACLLYPYEINDIKSKM